MMGQIHFKNKWNICFKNVELLIRYLDHGLNLRLFLKITAIRCNNNNHNNHNKQHLRLSSRLGFFLSKSNNMVEEYWVSLLNRSIKYPGEERFMTLVEKVNLIPKNEGNQSESTLLSDLNEYKYKYWLYTWMRCSSQSDFSLIGFFYLPFFCFVLTLSFLTSILPTFYFPFLSFSAFVLYRAQSTMTMTHFLLLIRTRLSLGALFKHQAENLIIQPDS